MHMRQHGKADAAVDEGKTVDEAASKYVVDMGGYARVTRGRLGISLGRLVCRHYAIPIRCSTCFVRSCSVLFSDFYSAAVASIPCCIFTAKKSTQRTLLHDFYLDRVDVTL
jgi:hypothetical protein